MTVKSRSVTPLMRGEIAQSLNLFMKITAFAHLSPAVLLVLLLLALDSSPVPLAVVNAVVTVYHSSGNVLIADDGIAGIRRRRSPGTAII